MITYLWSPAQLMFTMKRFEYSMIDRLIVKMPFVSTMQRRSPFCVATRHSPVAKPWTMLLISPASLIWRECVTTALLSAKLRTSR